ncbi:MAG: hypothetical protein EPN82_08870 [Bacteroidetes bacterium]|nr:MAG: hypothetical protein EPN82_08870 [Bacteroidota bacterium]
MKKFILIIFIISFLIISFIACSKNVKENSVTVRTPLEYLEYIIGEQNKIIPKMLDFNQALESGEEGRIEHMLTLLQKQTESSVDEVMKLKPFEGDKTFKKAALELFEFYQSISNDEFVDMAKIFTKKDKMTQDDFDEITELRRNIIDREKILDQNLSNAQKTFADKYQYRLEQNRELQDKINKGG